MIKHWRTVFHASGSITQSVCVRVCMCVFPRCASMACAATLQDELEAFIGDYQQREQSHADNHWILKPVCRIGGSLSNPRVPFASAC